MEEFLKHILTEYGVLVSFLVVSVSVLLFTIKILWKQNQYLSDRLLETVENNTKVLTQITEKLKVHDE